MRRLKMKELLLSEFLFSVDFVKLMNIFRSHSLICSLIVIKLFFDSPELKGAFEKKNVGASSFAMGNAAVAINQYLYAIYYNPAAISNGKKFQLAFSYQNYFGIADINSIDLMAKFSLAGQPISFAINRFGNQLYQEFQFTVASRYKIFQNCAIGISFQSYVLSIRQYGQVLTWGLNISTLYKLLPNLSIGAMITNLNQPVISSTRENLPQTMNLGFCYIPVSNLLISFEVFEDIRFDQEIRVGISYRMMPLLIARIGIEDRLNLYSCGLGVDMDWSNFDYALIIHPALGTSHVLTISILL